MIDDVSKKSFSAWKKVFIDWGFFNGLPGILYYVVLIVAVAIYGSLGINMVVTIIERMTTLYDTLAARYLRLD